MTMMRATTTLPRYSRHLRRRQSSAWISTAFSNSTPNKTALPTTSVVPQRLPFFHPHNHTTQFNRRFSLYVSPEDDDDIEEEAPLVSLNNVQLKYPSSKGSMIQADLNIAHARHGGHVILGRNGTGKSLVSSAIAEGFQQHRAALRRQMQFQSVPDNNSYDETSDGSTDSDYFQKGQLTLCQDQVWHGQAVAHVSFESHEELLALRDDRGDPLSVQKAIASGGALNKAAQFLVVRFGLFHMLHRDVTSLSTGEIRKVLIVRALAHRPRLLVLDNAFDGLDVPSRDSLAELVTKTLRGFRPDILVQAVDSKATAHTQVVLITHRPEEIVEPITTVSYCFIEEGNSGNVTIQTEDREGRSGHLLLKDALGTNNSSGSSSDGEVVSLWKEKPAHLPTVDDVTKWWQEGRSTPSKNDPQSTLVSMDNLKMQRGQATLLADLGWTVQPGQHWWIAGGNGAGKSTLSRLLARQPLEDSGIVQGSLDVDTRTSNDNIDQPGDRRRGVGWVSTESHMALARSPQSTQEVLTQHYEKDDSEGDTTPLHVATKVLEWLDMPTSDDFLQRPFAQLSQGEQKLVLLAAALAARPPLIVLDEPCQGLDAFKRRRVLQLVERICSSTSNDLSLVYITHHPEEVMPSVGHVLHLAKGQDVYQGSRDNYDAKVVADKAAALVDSENKANNKSRSSAKNSLV